MSGFRQFGLSEATLSGLEENGYKEPTPVQSKAIPIAIKGEDVLGAARTGSGKTLAFLIPVLERLDELKWSSIYGLGVLIITPTRELAYQIYEVLRKIGRHHDFSAGLIIGGKDLKFEWSRLEKTNIIICTPGRLLQHMDQNPSFDCSNLQMLILDEADRILDMGFAEDVNAIIANLPAARQTLLFSATQTRSVQDLARLSLTDPNYVSADEDAPFSTPDNLKQSFIVMNSEDKLNFLWSFLTFHRQSKILVFVACCKEVKFFYDILCHLRPGISVLALYGTQHQLRRMEVYDSFHRKEHAVLLATDVASRGLDFPKIDWVVQLDCPDDPNQYIHRAGRTARYNRGGAAILALTPVEEQRFLPLLEAKKVPIEKLETNLKHLKPIRNQLESVLAKFPELKESAQRCFKAYLKSIWLVRKKEVMTIDLNAYSASLGLHITPRIRFLERHRRETDRVHQSKVVPQPFFNDKEDSDDDILVPKKKSAAASMSQLESVPENPLPVHQPNRVTTKTMIAKRLHKKGIMPNIRMKFDDNGNIVEMNGAVLRNSATDLATEDQPIGHTGLDLTEAKELIVTADAEDRLTHRKRIKDKHKEERKKRKLLRRKPGQPAGRDELGQYAAEEEGATLGNYEDGSEEGVTLGSYDDDTEEGVTLENYEGEIFDEEPRQVVTASKKSRKHQNVSDDEEASEARPHKNLKKQQRKVMHTEEQVSPSVKSSQSKSKHRKLDSQTDEEFALQLLLG